MSRRLGPGNRHIRSHDSESYKVYLVVIPFQSIEWRCI